MNTVSEDAKINAFLACTKRFDEILEHFPIEFRLGAKDLSEFDKKYAMQKWRTAENGRVGLAVIRYFNLCSEEFFLNSINCLPKGIWQFWQAQMEVMFKNKLVSEVWQENRTDFDSQADFQAFVDSHVEPSG